MKSFLQLASAGGPCIISGLSNVCIMPPKGTAGDDRQASSSGPEPDWLSMRAAAAHVSKSYTWLSRHWKGLGLRPRTMGRDFRFSRKELDAMIARQRPAPRAKRQKVVKEADA